MSTGVSGFYASYLALNWQMLISVRACVDMRALPLMLQFSSMIVGCLLVHQSERYVVHGYVPLAVEVRGRVLELVLTHLQEGDAASAKSTTKVHRYIIYIRPTCFQIGGEVAVGDTRVCP